MPIKKRFILMAAGVLGVGLPPVAWASAPGRAGVNPTCQNIPAQYAGKTVPYAFDDQTSTIKSIASQPRRSYEAARTSPLARAARHPTRPPR